MFSKKYLEIVSHYESCLEKHGDTNLGVDWPKEKDVDTRHKVMLEVIKKDASRKLTLLDFGCGTSYFYEYILREMKNAISNQIEVIYSGLDLSEKFIQVSRSKFPSNTYYCLDILENSIDLPAFDYVIMNGVFTEKRALSFDEMLVYFESSLQKIFDKAKVGIAFNVMSKQVDWERDELFHLPLDTLTSFLAKNLSRNFIIRNDYGLYEYTTYVYK